MYTSELTSFHDGNSGRKSHKVPPYVHVNILCHGTTDCKHIGLTTSDAVRYAYFRRRTNSILGLITSDLCIKFMVLKTFDCEQVCTSCELKAFITDDK